MATLSDIRDYVREQTLIESDDWGDTKINRVINQGLLRLSTKFQWPWLASTTTLAVVAGTDSYTLPTDVAHIEAVVRQDKPQRLVEVGSHEVLGPNGGDLPTGAPTAYYVHGRTMYLDKVPTESATYDLLYYANGATLANDTDEPPFVEQFHLVLGDWAIAKAWQREEDFTKADSAMAEFNAGVEEMAQFYLDIGRDHPIVVGAARNLLYGGGSNNMPWLDGVS